MPKQYLRPANMSEGLNLALALGLRPRKKFRVFATTWAAHKPEFGLSESDAARIARVAWDPQSLVGKYPDTEITGILAYNPDGFVALFAAVRGEVLSWERTVRAAIETVAARAFIDESARAPLDSALVHAELSKCGISASSREIQKVLNAYEMILKRVGKPKAAIRKRKG